MQKGYCVYFPDTWRFINSIDVTFHEDVPYFSVSTTPLRVCISPPPPPGGFPSIPISSLSPSLEVSTTVRPFTMPPALLTSNDCLTPPPHLIHTHASSSYLPLTNLSTPLVTSFKTLVSTLSSPTPPPCWVLRSINF